ncbi:FAD-dependent monooxygenase [Rhodoplanes sp. Z2-YC6860]|uniref:FAD-dependent monooxygenase n=1 Tax=Rhodoplanes sp. Z2-YC6860 TaxID=674703 RepID=UPI00078D9B07|nr:FAD-dependent monooxygenase [Rhodoplanes sp. Z2-YC6860]AMN41096.1 salicylate 1-monooxygenase [Rhodoplanes sp. Z2-YC6860]
MTRSSRIAIIGAGLGGATAGALLQRAGFEVRLYEQAQTFERIGAGIHVSANVMKVLRLLEAEKRLSSIGIHPDTFTSRKWDTGEILFELPLGSLGERQYGASYITVHRSDLHAAILEKVLPDSVEFGKRLADVKIDRGIAQLSFADGSSAEADIVIGADGVNSRLREAVVGPRKARFIGAVAHRAIYPSSLLDGLEVRNCTKWWGPNSHILIYFIEQSRNEIYLVTSAKGEWRSPASWEYCDRDEVLRAFDGFHPEVRTVIERAPQLTKWPILDVEPLEKWTEGPLVLIGDACHAMTPYMASGAAMAIEDAAVLVRCLVQSGDQATAFGLYEATRKPRVRKVQQISAENTFLRLPTDPSWVFGYDAATIPLGAYTP